MRQATWNPQGGPYVVTSYGSGLSYLVRDTRDGREFFLQGDDAAHWRDQYDKADSADNPAALALFLSDSMADYGASA